MGTEFGEFLLLKAGLVTVWSTNLIAEHPFKLAPDGLTATADSYVNEALSETHVVLLSSTSLPSRAGAATLCRPGVACCPRSFSWITLSCVWLWISVVD